MEERYYTYSGELNEFEDAEFFNQLFDQSLITYKVKDIIGNILSDDEILEKEMEFPKLPSGMLGMLIPKYNININIKISTLALIALILDITVTKGIASYILGMTGLNIRSIVKLDEAIGEKCVLIEVYRKEHHKADAGIFTQISGRECVNNDMDCKYRVQGLCSIDQVKVKEILEDLTNKNIFTKENNLYKYNF